MLIDRQLGVKPDAGHSVRCLAESVQMGTVANRVVKEQVIWNAKVVQFLDKREATKGLGRALPSDQLAAI